jgi:hypothetical protein
LGLKVTSCRIGSNSSFLRIPVDFEGIWPSMRIGYNCGTGVGGVTTILGTRAGAIAGSFDLGAFREFGVFMAPVLSTDVSWTFKTSSSRGVRRVVPVVVLSSILAGVVAGGWCICQRKDRKS